MEGRMPIEERNDNKLRELILYIARESEGDDTFGATKLNKVLFYADFMAYVNLGNSITGQEYQALAHGPALRRLAPMRDEMLVDGDIAIRPRDYYGYVQDRILALTTPDLSEFSAAEIALVNHFIRAWWGKTATEISRRSHQFAGWRYAQEGETIPYEVALVGWREPTGEEIRRGKELEELALEFLAKHQ